MIQFIHKTISGAMFILMLIAVYGVIAGMYHHIFTVVLCGALSLLFYNESRPINERREK